MSNMPPRNTPETHTQELRFTAREPALDEALAMLERDGERRSEHLPKNLFLFAAKRIAIDQTDMIDGYSKNYSRFTQYQQAVGYLTNHGLRRFKLDSWMKELRLGGPEKSLMGVGLRLRVEPQHVDSLLTDPFYEAENYRREVSLLQDGPTHSSYDVLWKDQGAAYIPVRYEIGKAVDDPAEALERLGAVLALGTWASQLRMVPSYPRSARYADIDHAEPLDRTYQHIDDRFAAEIVPFSAQRTASDDEKPLYIDDD